MNPEPILLSEEINNLRKKFHLKLANKRGLSIKQEDLINMHGYKDDIIQLRLERVSLLRQFFKRFSSEQLNK